MSNLTSFNFSIYNYNFNGNCEICGKNLNLTILDDMFDNSNKINNIHLEFDRINITEFSISNIYNNKPSL